MTTPNGTPLEDLDDIVIEVVAAAVGVDPAEVDSTSTLAGDLEAESLDMLDMLFRIEKRTGIKIQMAEITSSLQGEVSNADFVTADGYVSPVGLAQLKTMLPQIDVDALTGNLEDTAIFALFTVGNLTDMVKRASQAFAVAS